MKFLIFLALLFLLLTGCDRAPNGNWVIYNDDTWVKVTDYTTYKETVILRLSKTNGIFDTIRITNKIKGKQ